MPMPAYAANQNASLVFSFRYSIIIGGILFSLQLTAALGAIKKTE